MGFANKILQGSTLIISTHSQQNSPPPLLDVLQFIERQGICVLLEGAAFAEGIEHVEDASAHAGELLVGFYVLTCYCHGYTSFVLLLGYVKSFYGMPHDVVLTLLEEREQVDVMILLLIWRKNLNMTT